jgi:hypothetical protein
MHYLKVQQQCMTVAQFYLLTLRYLLVWAQIQRYETADYISSI